MFSKLRLKHRILLGYAIPIVLLVGLTATVYLGNARLQNTLVELNQADNLIKEVDLMILGVEEIQRSVLSYVLTQDEAFKKHHGDGKDVFDESVTYINGVLENPNLTEMTLTSTQRQNLIGLVTAGEDLKQFAETLVNSDSAAEAVALVASESTRTIDKLESLEQAFVAETERIIQERTDAANSDIRFIDTVIVAGTLAVIVISVGGGLYISSGITGALNQATATIAASATEIAATIEQQERTAAQQAASVGETTTTMDELEASSRQSAEQVDMATAQARQAIQVAESGTATVRQTLSEMVGLKGKVAAIAEQILRLSEQISQIGTITNLVGDLANQTNMLALNAAVEAARAGEHGKGFAVVASEIRKLADQSKQSAERINDLVADIQNATNATVMVTEEGTKTVAAGTELVQETGAAFGNLATAINNVFENMQQISLNVKQQAAAIGQVVQAMNSINAGAQETASGIRQTKTGILQLDETAQGLKVLV